jgi:hypothetical protein
MFRARGPRKSRPEELAAKAAYQRALRADRIARGECVRCEAPLFRGENCEAHYRETQAKKRERYAARVAAKKRGGTDASR